MTKADFAAAVLKGVIEHGDAGFYFGSTSALRQWMTIATERGWITVATESGRVTERATATEAGRRHYAESGLESFPKTRGHRAYFWDWSGYKGS